MDREKKSTLRKVFVRSEEAVFDIWRWKPGPLKMEGFSLDILRQKRYNMKWNVLIKQQLCVCFF